MQQLRVQILNHEERSREVVVDDLERVIRDRQQLEAPFVDHIGRYDRLGFRVASVLTPVLARVVTVLHTRNHVFLDHQATATTAVVLPGDQLVSFGRRKDVRVYADAWRRPLGVAAILDVVQRGEVQEFAVVEEIVQLLHFVLVGSQRLRRRAQAGGRQEVAEHQLAFAID